MKNECKKTKNGKPVMQHGKFEERFESE